MDFSSTEGSRETQIKLFLSVSIFKGSQEKCGKNYGKLTLEIHFHANMLLTDRMFVRRWWQHGCSKPGQSSRRDSNDPYWPADIESTCDYVPVIYGLISGFRSQQTPVSPSFYLFHSSFKPLLYFVHLMTDSFTVHAGTRGLSEESVNSEPLHHLDT